VLSMPVTKPLVKATGDVSDKSGKQG